jgi:catechol 2,3-dioxygenase-like lactoylglutathione lyase family enzyme
VDPEHSVFNHIGICVTDVERSRAFYENALDFLYWWELDAPEESATLLMLDTPVNLRAVYLVRDGLVLELLHYHPDRYEPARTRSMAEPGLTHMSISVPDMEEAFRRVEQHGGKVLRDTYGGPAAMVRDPDGQLIELLTMDWRASLPPMPDDA